MGDDIASGRLDGLAEDIYRVKPLEKDARGNGGQSFADLQEQEESDKNGSKQNMRKGANILKDDVFLSDEAMKEAQKALEPASDAGKPAPDPDSDNTEPGCRIDFQA